MINGTKNKLVRAPINPYVSFSYTKKNLSLINKNALLNPNFLVWQRYDMSQLDSISYSDLLINNGYISDKWYIKDYSFGSQNISITRSDGLYTNSSKLVNSIKIETGNNFVSSLSMNVALSQDIASDKLFNLLNKPLALSFYVKSSLIGNYTCSLSIFDYNLNIKHIKMKSFKIIQKDVTQKVIVYFDNISFPNLSLEKRSIAARLDISISGNNTVSDTEWHTYDINDITVTSLSNQTNLFTGNNDYIQISNIGLQSCLVGHTPYPELNNIDYQKDLLECQEFFERIYINRLNLFYNKTLTDYSYWDATFKLNTIKRNNNPTFTIKNRSSKLYYKIPGNMLNCDISDVLNIKINKEIGTLYTQKECSLELISSSIQNDNILYSYANNFIIDVE